MEKNHDSIYSKILEYLSSAKISGRNDDEIIAKISQVLGLPFKEVSSAFGALRTHRLLLRETTSSLNLADKTSKIIVRFSVAKQEIENNKTLDKAVRSPNKINSDHFGSREVQEILRARTRASSQNGFKTIKDSNIGDIIKNPQRIKVSNYANSGIFVNDDRVRKIRRGGLAGADRAGTW